MKPALFLLLPLLLGAETISGKVVKVVDGDTLHVLRGKELVKVRLHGIDAPEKSQPFGKSSREGLANLCAGEIATIQVKTTDRYSRKVAVVECRGVNANREQVKRGLAWAYIRYSKDYAGEELEAKRAKRGLWSEPNPVSPWDFRRSSK